jgi:hypothetical protein
VDRLRSTGRELAQCFPGEQGELVVEVGGRLLVGSSAPCRFHDLSRPQLAGRVSKVSGDGLIVHYKDGISVEPLSTGWAK